MRHFSASNFQEIVLRIGFAALENAVGGADEEEDDEGEDQEVDHHGDELAPAEYRDSGGFQIGIARRIALEAVGNPPEQHEIIAEIEPAENCPDDRHDDVVGEAGDDRSKGGADHHRDREVEDVAARNERLEFAQHGRFPQHDDDRAKMNPFVVD